MTAEGYRSAVDPVVVDPEEDLGADSLAGATVVVGIPGEEVHRNCSMAAKSGDCGHHIQLAVETLKTRAALHSRAVP